MGILRDIGAPGLIIIILGSPLDFWTKTPTRIGPVHRQNVC